MDFNIWSSHSIDSAKLPHPWTLTPEAVKPGTRLSQVQPLRERLQALSSRPSSPLSHITSVCLYIYKLCALVSDLPTAPITYPFYRPKGFQSTGRTEKHDKVGMVSQLTEEPRPILGAW
jgi:hypothetical protein